MSKAIVRATDVKAGARLIADDGFSCIPAGKVCVVQAVTVEGEQRLHVNCEYGAHYLDGQFNEGGSDITYDHYIGFWLEGEQPSTLKVIE